MTRVYVLDSFAILSLLGKEGGSEDVTGVLREAQEKKARVLMNWVNVGEVAYIVERRWGKEKVHQVLGTLEATEVEILGVERELALGAAGIKAAYPVAYADAYAAAMALKENAVLITGDPEFEQVKDLVRIHWLPRKGKE